MTAPVTSVPEAAENGRVWTLLLVGAVVWMLLALVGALVLGRGIRLADERTSGPRTEPVLTTAALAG